MNGISLKDGYVKTKVQQPRQQQHGRVEQPKDIVDVPIVLCPALKKLLRFVEIL